MAKKPKKAIYCGNCEHVAVWYKKGKYRKLICDNCGVIAHNPVPLLMAAGSFLAKKGIQKIISPKTERTPPPEHAAIQYTDSKDKANYSERVINKVMKDERL